MISAVLFLFTTGARMVRDGWRRVLPGFLFLLRRSNSCHRNKTKAAEGNLHSNAPRTSRVCCVPDEKGGGGEK